MNLYSDHDRTSCAWLRELVQAGLLPEGKVDEREIQAVQGSDLAAYTQCHFFAGIGGWPYALQLAGWPTDRPVWTGSCPCQPFSAAGKGKAEEDERHLWPAWLALIRECCPNCIFGEQVSSRDGYRWLDGVRTDLEQEGYAFGSADLPAASVGSPHVRQRLWWVARHSSDAGRASVWCERQPIPGETTGSEGQEDQRQRFWADAGDGVRTGHLSNDCGERRNRRPRVGGSRRRPTERSQEVGDAGDCSRSSFWSKYELLSYQDNKTRRVEPGTFPLADGIPGRLGLLRGYGNAIVVQVAAAFVRAFMETEPA